MKKAIFSFFAALLLLGFVFANAAENAGMNEVVKTPTSNEAVNKSTNESKSASNIALGKNISEQAKTIEKSGQVRAEWAKSIKGMQVLRVIDKLKETKEKYEEVKEKWKEAKGLCEKQGNCSMYLNRTKELVLTAISKLEERLQSVNASEEEINKLEALKARVEAASSLEELRAVYGEVKDAVREGAKIHARLALKHVAALYLERLQARPEFPGKAEIISRIESVINTAEQKEPNEIVKELKEIRKDIIEIRKETREKANESEKEKNESNE
ncbi:MAG: hypothetical protein QXI89_01745 [Candidatus Anstonellales archaeon]